MSTTTILRVADEAAVIAALGEHIVRAAAAAVADTGCFRIGLSGGSLVKYLAKLAGDDGGALRSTDWSKWQVFFCDERYVPESDADSTYGQYLAAFVPHTGLKAEQFLRLDASLELNDCAHAYEQEIYRKFGIQDVSEDEMLLLLSMKCFPLSRVRTARLQDHSAIRSAAAGHGTGRTHLLPVSRSSAAGRGQGADRADRRLAEAAAEAHHDDLSAAEQCACVRFRDERRRQGGHGPGMRNLGCV